MKRFISIILCLAMLTGMMTGLAGCGNTEENTLTVGQWLSMVNEAFGMQSYITEEPFFSNVSKDNPYFETVQIATEWEVIDKAEGIDVEDVLTWEKTLITLVNVGNFMAIDASKEEKIQYAIDYFDNSIKKYWMNRAITPAEATFLLVTAQEQWVGRKYETPIEEIEYAEGVKDYSAGENIVDDYSIEDGKVVIPLEEGVQILEGDVFILPPNMDTLEVKAYKATSVESDSENLYVVVDDDLELEDIAEKIFIQETVVATSENTVIRDGNGNVISVGNDVLSAIYNNQRGNIVLDCSNATASLMTVASSKVAHTFKVDDWEISLKYDLNGKLDLAVEVESPNLLEDKGDKELKGTLEVEISDLEITNKIDFEWLKLNEASIKVDYNSKFSTEFKYKDALIDEVFAPKYSNGNGKFLSNLKRSVLKDKNLEGNGAKTIKICSVDIYSIGIARACLDVNLNVAIDGSISVSVTEHGVKGLEYKDKKLRVINESSKDVDLEAKVKLEGTVGIGPALYTVGLKEAIIGAQVQVGLGASFSYTLHLADSENHLLEECNFSDVLPEADGVLETLDLEADPKAIQELAESQGFTYSYSGNGNVKLRLDRCVDISGYFILRIQLTDTSYAAKLLDGKIKVSWEIFGAKNARLLNIHCENGDWPTAFANAQFGWAVNEDQCTMKYTPFDSTEETETEVTETTSETLSPIEQGHRLMLGELKTTLEVGDKYYIVIQQIPEGYTMQDIVFSSDANNVVSIESNGVAIAKGEGSTILTVSTKDGKYKAYCAVTVVLPEIVNSHVVEYLYMDNIRKNLA